MLCYGNGYKFFGGSSYSVTEGSVGGGGWYGGGAGQGPGGGGSSYTDGLMNPYGSSGWWTKYGWGDWRSTDAGLESLYYKSSSHGLVIFLETFNAQCPPGTYKNSTFTISGNEFIHCVPCTGDTYSHGGAASCRSCQGIGKFTANDKSCSPSNGPSDTVFYFSGTIEEGTDTFTTSVTSSVNHTVGFDGRMSSALSITNKGRAGIWNSSTSIPLPSGTKSRTITAWIRANASSRTSSLVSWGTFSLGAYFPSCSIYREFGTAVAATATPVIDYSTRTPITSPYKAIIEWANGGRLIIAETGYHRIRFTDPATGYTGVLAGTGTAGFTNDGDLAIYAAIDTPKAIVADLNGNVYIAVRNRVRKINAAGIISLVAGNGNDGNTGDNGPAVIASMNPTGLAINIDGNVLYVSSNSAVRAINLDTGIITRILGWYRW